MRGLIHVCSHCGRQHDDPESTVCPCGGRMYPSSYDDPEPGLYECPPEFTQGSPRRYKPILGFLDAMLPQTVGFELLDDLPQDMEAATDA